MANDHSQERADREPMSSGALPAPLVRRVLAFLIDLVPAAIFYFLAIGEEWIQIGVALCVFIAWHAIPVGAPTGRTFGKMLLGLRVELPIERGPRWVYAFLRPTAGYAATVFSGVGLLQIVVHPTHRALHDFFCSSHVVLVEPERSPLAILRRLDEWSKKFYEWQESLFARFKRAGRLLRRLAELAFGINAVLLFLSRILKASAAGGGGAGQGSAGAASGAASSSAGGTAAGAGAGGAGAGATSAGIATVVATAPAVATAVAVAGLSIAVYDTVAPRPVRIFDRTPVAEVAGVEVKGRKVIVLKDMSGSMRAYTAARKAMVDRLKSVGMHISEIDVNTGGVQGQGNVIGKLREALAANPKADTVYLFSDFREQSDKAGLEELDSILRARSLRLYVGTVDRSPGLELIELATKSGGGLVPAPRERQTGS